MGLKNMWHVGIDVGGTFTDLFASNQQTQKATRALRSDVAMGISNDWMGI